MTVWIAVEHYRMPFSFEGYSAEEFMPIDINSVQYQVNSNLFLNSRVITSESLNCPEDVAVDEEGNIYTGLHNGEIVMIDKNNKETLIAKTSGGLILGVLLSKEMLYFAS
jgi:hypothetical protein